MITNHIKLLVFPYGKDYNFHLGKNSNSENYDIVIYKNVKEVTEAINSLEGVFVSENEIFLSRIFLDEISCRRDQMESFARMHRGRFIPFAE